MANFLHNFFLISTPSLIIFTFVFFLLFILKILAKKKFSFSLRMIVALFFGLCLGLGLQIIGDFPNNVTSLKDTPFHWYFEVNSWFSFFISIFISILKLFIIPTVFIVIIHVVINIDSNVNMYSLFSTSIFWFLLTTALAALIGTSLGIFMDLGVGAGSMEASTSIKEVKSLNQILLGIIPNNIMQAMSTNNVIGVFIFAFFIAFGIRSVAKDPSLSKSIEIFSSVLNICYKAIMKILLQIINIMPYMIVLMIANTIMSNGISFMISAMEFIALIYLSSFLMFSVHCILLIINGLNPFKYIKKSITPLLMAFTSRSSSATLPITISTLINKFGVSESSSSFVASLGTTIGMNGCSGYFAGLIAVFLYNMLGISIGFSEVFMIVLLSVIASIGVAGIPGISIMVISVLLTGLGLESNFALLGFILAIDPITDMARTHSNVSGAMTASILTDKKLGLLNIKKYNE